MRLHHLSLQDFRNYPHIEFHPSPDFTFLYGPNGAGKTNLLESIYFLSHLRSFRRTPRKGMIRFGAEGMHLKGTFERAAGGGPLVLEAGVQGSERRYRVNDREEPNLLHYLCRVHSVIFFPESLSVIKEGPFQRRGFFDRAIAADDPGHLTDSREYNHILSERNRILKESKDFDIVDVWKERLVTAATRIIARRINYLASFHRQLIVLSERFGLSGRETLSVDYIGGGFVAGDVSGGIGSGADRRGKADEERIRSRLQSAAAALFQEERRRGVTLFGPHRDDFLIRWEGQSAREAASQGEQRLAVIMLVLASVMEHKEARGEETIVLLDDLSSELDEERRATVLSVLDDMASQVFITSTEKPAGAVSSREARFYRVLSGRLITDRAGR